MGIEPALRPAAVIRLLAPSDGEGYRLLRIEAARDPAFGATPEIEIAYPVALLRQALVPREHGFMLGAFVDDQLVAMVGFGVGADNTRGTLYGLFVTGASRRLGLGAALVEHLEQQIPASIQTIELTVAGTNTAAIHLYEACGYRRAANQQDPDALMLVRSLQDPAQVACTPVTGRRSD
ncbi:MAG: GNAT family N-acetyltransferase [Pseudomonadales bacterium]